MMPLPQTPPLQEPLPHRVPLDELRARVVQLPPLPEVVNVMMQALNREDASIARCAELLQRDQALTARVLRLANSAFYGVPGRVASVHDAINLIGLRSLRSLVATVALTQQFPAAPGSAAALGAFWRHTVAVAFASRALAAAHGLDEELAYTAGLLHDVGRLALAAHFPAAHAAVRQAAQRAGRGGPLLERLVTGTDHAEVGALVAAHWHLPAAVVDVIARHHQPDEAATACTLLDVVHVADVLAHGLGHPHEARPPTPPAQPGPWHRVGLERLPQDALVQQVQAAVADTCTALGL